MTDVITVADQEWNCIMSVIAEIFVLHSNTGDGDDCCRDPSVGICCSTVATADDASGLATHTLM